MATYPQRLDICIDEAFLDERNRDYHARQLAASRQMEDAPDKAESRTRSPGLAMFFLAVVVCLMLGATLIGRAA